MSHSGKHGVENHKHREGKQVTASGMSLLLHDGAAALSVMLQLLRLRGVIFVVRGLKFADHVKVLAMQVLQDSDSRDAISVCLRQSRAGQANSPAS